MHSRNRDERRVELRGCQYWQER